MSTFFMIGKYSPEAMKKISADRTKKATSLIEKFGGTVTSGYALLGEHDLVLIANFPDTQEAMKASVALSDLTGISISTYPAMTVEEFDKIISEI